MKKHNDALLVSRAALLGDRNAFGRLVEAYQSPIRRFFYNLTKGDEELSKDLAQDTFVKAWLHIGSFRAAATFSTWLFRIAYRVFYDDVRAKRPIAQTDVVNTKQPTTIAVSGKDFEIDFKEALRLLNEYEQAAMLLFYIEDQTVTNIARILQCPIGTVKSHLHRGKEKMTPYFEHYA
ncbi:MAG: RNA polymerase sigma factor [Bacteroidetes bacterium]|nr:RNA polymerase sigma factor [Bacteroidota bacterium]